MTILADLIADVVIVTKRPDLAATTIPLAVKSATLKIHNFDFWEKDIFEYGIAFPTSEFIQTLDYKALIPRWKAVKYFRKCDSFGVPIGPNKGEFEIITPDSAFDDYNLEKPDVVYLAGSNYQFKSSIEFQYLLFGAYLYPDVTDATFASWIANDHKYAIVYEAAAKVLGDIGKDKEAADKRNDAAFELHNIITTNTVTQGS